MEPKRCPWPTDELYCAYHDQEWGVPNHDDRHLIRQYDRDHPAGAAG